MSWRTVYISEPSHLSFKNNYLVVRSEGISQIHLSEIHTIIVDNNMSSISVYLLNELIKFKIKLVLCDEKHNPSMEMIPYYGSYDSSKVIAKEISWQRENCGVLWQKIIKYKIKYQANVLKSVDENKCFQLTQYANEVEIDDLTNREGHAAKVYFNTLFGKDFSRYDENNVINAYLNYGYSIILSMINREIINNGYLTQIGIHHRGVNNPFNLSCDLMEPFRPIVDLFTYENYDTYFGKQQKIELVNLMNKKFLYEGKSQFLTNLIGIYIKKVLDGLEKNEILDDWFEYEVIEE